MGGSTSSSVDWRAYSSSSATRSATAASTFTTKVADDKYLAKNITIRESRDSVANPESTPVIMALDCTGSMRDVILSAVKNIGILFGEIYDRKPVSDPHVMVMYFDDVDFEGANSLQLSQFESDKIIIEQMKELHLTNNGGGNGWESNHLPLYAAINKTDCDAFKKGRKGFIFEMGDELVPQPLTEHQIKTVFGADEAVSGPLTYEDLLAQAEENWHVFHIVPTRGAAARYTRQIEDWRRVLGERVIVLEDIDKLAEVLVAVMQVIHGADKAHVAASFADPGTSLVVAKAIEGLVPAVSGGTGGVARL